ncbi:hypothetical protein GZH53_12065 [Flavihumibacter sp. R14]|nr:hypothetical protein [Flavihumibacter soli]
MNMRNIRKSIGTGISVILLLCFSVTVLPMDFFHDHAQQVVCKDSQPNKTCKHSTHVTAQKAYCWVCAIHFDRNFTSPDLFDNLSSLPAASIFSENEITSYFFECLFSALRGPPQN